MPTLVYSLEFELPPTKAGSLCLIAPLDRYGNAKDCRPATPGKKLADIVPGDWILLRGHRYQVVGVKPYRSHQVPDEFSRSYRSKDGYLRP